MLSAMWTNARALRWTTARKRCTAASSPASRSESTCGWRFLRMLRSNRLEGRCHRRRLRSGCLLCVVALVARGDEVISCDVNPPAEAIESVEYLTWTSRSDEDWVAAHARVLEKWGRAFDLLCSTMQGSPAAVGSTSPAWTSGSGSPRSICSGWSAVPRAFRAADEGAGPAARS